MNVIHVRKISRFNRSYILLSQLFGFTGHIEWCVSSIWLSSVNVSSQGPVSGVCWKKACSISKFELKEQIKHRSLPVVLKELWTPNAQIWHQGNIIAIICVPALLNELYIYRATQILKLRRNVTIWALRRAIIYYDNIIEVIMRFQHGFVCHIWFQGEMTRPMALCHWVFSNLLFLKLALWLILPTNTGYWTLRLYVYK